MTVPEFVSKAEFERMVIDISLLRNALEGPDYPHGIARCNLAHAGFEVTAAEQLVEAGRAEWIINEADPDNRAVDNLRLT